MWVVSSMSKKILVICEGTKKDPEIIQYAQKLDLLPENLQIVSYGTNIYKLYNALEKESQGYPDGWDSLDIQLSMIHSARTEDEKSVLMDSYTDKLLIFDFDPQDSFFRNHRDEACRRFQKLMEFFSESTDHGKLYLSYPMIEAFLHVRAAEISHGCFNAFFERQFSVGELRKSGYKQRVRNEGESSITSYNRESMIRLIRAHLAKAEQLTGCNEQDVISSYSDELAIELLNVEIESVKSRMLGDVVSCSLFYVVESYPQRLQVLPGD